MRECNIVSDCQRNNDRQQNEHNQDREPTAVVRSA
jgi:hypothetical protein